MAAKHVSAYEKDTLLEQIKKLQDENMKLHNCLDNIVNRYVANRGNPRSEFISCITPKSARDLSVSERMIDPTWKVFDEARLLLGEKF